MELLKWQKKEIYKIIESIGFDPLAQFDLAEIHSPSSVIITHKDTGYRFTFEVHLDFDDREYLRLTYSPSKVKMVHETTLSIDDWAKLKGYLGVWLDCLKRELNTDDPWDELSKQKELFEAASEIGEKNTKFSADEVKLIESKLSEIKDLLLAKGLVDEDHQKVLNSQLKYLAESAKQQGRRDWVFLAYGVILQLFLEKALTPEALKIISPIVGELLRQISTGIRLLPL